MHGSFTKLIMVTSWWRPLSL